jgi:hypothetical protein
MSPAAFRKLALSLPGAYESQHVNHPDFRVGKKVFATLGYPTTAWGMAKLTPVQQRSFVHAHPAMFIPVKGGWGLKGATNIRLRAATVTNVRAALATAWRNVAPAALLAARGAPPPRARRTAAAAVRKSRARRAAAAD